MENLWIINGKLSSLQRFIASQSDVTEFSQKYQTEYEEIEIHNLMSDSKIIGFIEYSYPHDERDLATQRIIMYVEPTDLQRALFDIRVRQAIIFQNKIMSVDEFTRLQQETADLYDELSTIIKKYKRNRKES